MDGQAYLEYYYKGNQKHPDNVAVMSFIVEATKHLKSGARVLDLASGPAIYQAVPAARTASTIVLSDISPSLLGLSEKWRNVHKDAFDWDPFIEEILCLEAFQGIQSDDTVEKRKDRTRKAIDFAIIDIQKPQPIKFANTFDLVQCGYLGSACATSHENLVTVWMKCTSYLSPGGDMLILEVCDDATWRKGESDIYAYDIGYEDLSTLVDSIGMEVVAKRYVPSAATAEWGFSGGAFFQLKKPLD